MAKKYYKAPTHQTGINITTKTHFGSTDEMVVDHSKYLINDGLIIQDDQVICKDDRGFYITYKNRINTGLADTNRYANIQSRIILTEKQQNDSST